MNNNPIQIINMLKGSKDPKQMITNIVNMNGNPILKNLVEMAKNGDEKGVEEFARNIYQQQGRDFDKELTEFMSNFR